MPLNRRDALRLGAAAVTVLAEGLPAGAAASRPLAGDAYAFGGTEVVVHPVSHASFVLAIGGRLVYNDPVGPVAAYAGLPPPDLVLVSHQHADHFSPETLLGLVAEKTVLVVTSGVFALLPEALKGQALPLANGETTVVGNLPVLALPAYNVTEGRLNYHPRGRDNGYLLTLPDQSHLYIAGDSEDIVEMRALSGVDIAFLPMNLPYTMSVEQAASAVAAFAPRYVYPYHYKGSDLGAFARLVAASGVASEVVRRDWYA